jgi:hypothetical protein
VPRFRVVGKAQALPRLRVVAKARRFAKGCTDDEKLSEALAKLDKASLSKLVRDHKAGMLPIRLRTFPPGQRPG